MQYVPMMDIWTLSDEQLARLQPGQWVFCGGDRTNKGIWMGQRSTGSWVVAWAGNIEGRKDPEGYLRHLRHYAKH